jgi:hypothetical protein
MLLIIQVGQHGGRLGGGQVSNQTMARGRLTLRGGASNLAAGISATPTN